MKLAVPLNSQGEAWLLQEAGAVEFYCGIQTYDWENTYGNHDSISRRQGAANFSTFNELEELIAETRALNTPLFLTLNGSYTESQLPIVLKITETFEEIGGSGIMVTDVALLSLLKKRNSTLVRGLSLLAAVSNLSAMQFFADLGVNRVVFPRFLHYQHIKRITEKFPQVEAECIVWLDKCRFIDGYCRFIHSVDCSPACFELLGNPPDLPACGACGIDDLKKSGVSIFKIGGRGRSLETRLAGVRLLSKAHALNNPVKIKELYNKEFNFPCRPELCYCKELDNG